MIRPSKREQIFHLGGEAILQFVGIRDALPVNLVLGGAQNGDEIDGAVVFDGAAEELELPARLAFEIKDARLAGVDIHQPRDQIVLGAFLARQRIDGGFDGLHARGAGIEQECLALLLPVLLERDDLLRQDLAPSLTVSLAFCPA